MSQIDVPRHWICEQGSGPVEQQGGGREPSWAGLEWLARGLRMDHGATSKVQPALGAEALKKLESLKVGDGAKILGL